MSYIKFKTNAAHKTINLLLKSSDSKSFPSLFIGHAPSSVRIP